MAYGLGTTYQGVEKSELEKFGYNPKQSGQDFKQGAGYGASIGASVGSGVAPVVGTLVGAGVGALIGGTIGQLRGSFTDSENLSGALKAYKIDKTKEKEAEQARKQEMGFVKQGAEKAKKKQKTSKIPGDTVDQQIMAMGSGDTQFDRLKSNYYGVA
jgi:phage tail tape-measure protein